MYKKHINGGGMVHPNVKIPDCVFVSSDSYVEGGVEFNIKGKNCDIKIVESVLEIGTNIVVTSGNHPIKLEITRSKIRRAEIRYINFSSNKIPTEFIITGSNIKGDLNYPIVIQNIEGRITIRDSSILGICRIDPCVNSTNTIDQTSIINCDITGVSGTIKNSTIDTTNIVSGKIFDDDGYHEYLIDSSDLYVCHVSLAKTKTITSITNSSLYAVHLLHPIRLSRCSMEDIGQRNIIWEFLDEDKLEFGNI